MASRLRLLSNFSRFYINSSKGFLKSFRLCSNQVEPPFINGTEQVFSEKITHIVDDISKLTLVEVAQLNQLLKKALNIPDAPMMSMAAMAPCAATVQINDDDKEEKVEKTIFSVKLEKFDETKKVAIIKEIKNHITGMNLVQAKKFVESLPQIVKAEIPKEEAEDLKVALEKVGGTVRIY